MFNILDHLRELDYNIGVVSQAFITSIKAISFFILNYKNVT